MKVVRLNKTAVTAALTVYGAGLAYALAAVPFPRSVQLSCFLLLPALLLLVCAGRQGVRRVAAGLVGMMSFVSTVDTGFRGFLQATYQSDFLSGFVIESVANTHASEATQYFLTVWPEALLWTGLTLAVLAVQGVALRAYVHASHREVALVKPLVIALTCVTLIVGSVGWIVRPWRNQFPVFSWMKFYGQVQAFHDDWADAMAEMQEGKALAASLLTGTDRAKQTIVLVIGESVNRQNMGVYGYARETTPKLTERAQRDPQFQRVTDAWSVDASTIAAFRSMLTLPSTQDGSERDLNVLALFKQAGYRITWISNQDDLAIKSEFIEWADDKVILNLKAGRSTESFDEKVLDPLQKALAQPGDKRLIVVHMLGIHPHFSLRYPDSYSDAWTQRDAVLEHMQALDRSALTIESRNQYDRAMLYQDLVIDRTLALTQAEARGSTAWLYLSDHGVETGECVDQTGHSQTTPSGYTIPVLYWSNTDRLKSDLPGFRSDWLSHWLFDQAGIRWKNEARERSILSADYRWTPPASKQRFEAR